MEAADDMRDIFELLGFGEPRRAYCGERGVPGRDKESGERDVSDGFVFFR